MAGETEDSPEEPKKSGKLPLILGLVLALIGGAGGFGLVATGIIGGSSDTAEKAKADKSSEPQEAIEFVPLDPIMVSIGPVDRQRHLRFQAQLEVTPGSTAAVTSVLPRVTDVLNGYLRAVDLAHIEDPASLFKIRAQMLRRIQIIVGEGLVSDLLIAEFVLN